MKKGSGLLFLTISINVMSMIYSQDLLNEESEGEFTPQESGRNVSEPELDRR